MSKDSIIHFVGFITRIEPEDFVPQWEQYALHFKAGPGGMVLYQQDGSSKNKFKYLSRHEYNDSSVRFSFMQGRSSEQFPEQQVKVVQAGGYSPVQSDKRSNSKKNDALVLVFVQPQKHDTSFSSGIAYASLKKFEAYYENCLYSSILEFIIPDKELPGFLEQLNAVDGIEVSTYRNCMVPHL